MIRINILMKIFTYPPMMVVIVMEMLYIVGVVMPMNQHIIVTMV